MRHGRAGPELLRAAPNQPSKAWTFITYLVWELISPLAHVSPTQCTWLAVIGSGSGTKETLVLTSLVRFQSGQFVRKQPERALYDDRQIFTWLGHQWVL